MTYKITMADICELAHELTIRQIGEKAEKITRGQNVTVTYTKTGQQVFDDYYDLITNTLKI